MAEDDQEIRIILAEEEEKNKRKIVCVKKGKIKLYQGLAEPKKKEKPAWLCDVTIPGKPSHNKV